MPGVKGRSGGARSGAGRKAKPKPAPVVVEAATDDALKLLHDIAFGRIDVNANQLRAAIAAVQYTHTKRHDGGKKEDTAEKAEKAAGRFGARPVPLRAV